MMKRFSIPLLVGAFTLAVMVPILAAGDGTHTVLAESGSATW
jgi:hypothetical protein